MNGSESGGEKRWGAIIVAAGRGTRFGRPKQMIELAGMPVVGWSIALFASMPEICDIVIATEPDYVEALESLAQKYAFDKQVTIVRGGDTRQASVGAALAALPDRATAVLVHDGARPLVTTADVRAAMNEVGPGRASLLGVPAVDTMKLVEPGTFKVTRTLDRGILWAAQTPQCAMTKDLRRAHLDAERGDLRVTDDATLLERLGYDVVIVKSTHENFKITVEGDLARAEAILRERDPVLRTEKQVMLIEAFVDSESVDPLLAELAAREGTVDGIDREFPAGVAVRAYVPAEKLRGFREKFFAVAGLSATFTTRFSHATPRA